jgi:hypothetical protein
LKDSPHLRLSVGGSTSPSVLPLRLVDRDTLRIDGQEYRRVASGAPMPVPTGTVDPIGTAGSIGTVSPPTGMQPSTGAAFDPATATKVARGSTPEAHVKAYYQAILDKKWDVAFRMQPAASQAGKTVEQFRSTQEQMYGMTAFKVLSAKAEGDSATVEVEQTLRPENGTWIALWTFVRYNGNWVLETRAVQPKQ